MTKYKSKIGIGLFIFLAILFTFIGYKIFSEEFSLLALLIFIIPVILIAFIFISIKYNVENTNLNVSCCFFVNQNIDIKSIKKISETNNILGSPAASIDRLEIAYNKYGSIIVSPKNKKEFIDHILSINPNIEVVYKKK